MFLNLALHTLQQNKKNKKKITVIAILYKNAGDL